MLLASDPYWPSSGTLSYAYKAIMNESLWNLYYNHVSEIKLIESKLQ